MNRITLEKMIYAIASTLDIATKIEIGDGYYEVYFEKTALNKRFTRLIRINNDKDFDNVKAMLFSTAKSFEMDIIEEKLQGAIRIGEPRILW